MSNINPYASPSTFEEVVVAEVADEPNWAAGLWRKGNQLVMHKQANLPARCVKSNEPIEGRRLKRKLTWFHPLIYLSLQAGVLIFAILAIVLQKRATIYIGLTSEWHRRRRRALWAGWIIGLLGLAVLIGSIVVLCNSRDSDPPWAGLLGLLSGIIVILVGAIYGSAGSRMVTPVRITDDYVWLKGVHPDFLADLPPWPYRP
jgi:hypothetical protein